MPNFISYTLGLYSDLNWKSVDSDSNSNPEDLDSDSDLDLVNPTTSLDLMALSRKRYRGLCKHSQGDKHITDGRHQETEN